jgi:hypothetical protein
VNRYVIHLESNGFSDVLEQLIVCLFNSVLDIYYTKGPIKGDIIDLRGYSLQPIVILYPSENRNQHYIWNIPRGDIPPFILIKYKHRIHPILNVSMEYTSIFSLSEMSLTNLPLF